MFRLSTLLLVIFIVAGCKKEPPTVVLPAQDNLDFSWSGHLFVDMPITFSANAATGSTYFWDFGNGQTSNQPTPQVTFNVAGSYTVALTANGYTGRTVKKTLVIENGPVFVYTGIKVPGDTMRFSAILPKTLTAEKYLWDFGDGTTSTQATPYHIYSKDGTYTISLKINDTYNARGNETIIIKDPVYTNNAAGPREYKINITELRPWSTDSSYTRPDYAINIQYVNKAQLSIPDSSKYFAGIYTYDAVKSKNNTLVYGGPLYAELHYDHVKDTVYITQQTGGSKGDPIVKRTTARSK